MFAIVHLILVDGNKRYEHLEPVHFWNSDLDSREAFEYTALAACDAYEKCLDDWLAPRITTTTDQNWWTDLINNFRHWLAAFGK